MGFCQTEVFLGTLSEFDGDLCENRLKEVPNSQINPLGYVLIWIDIFKRLKNALNESFVFLEVFEVRLHLVFMATPNNYGYLHWGVV